MKIFRLMTALVLVAGLIAVFPAFGAKTTTEQKENAAKETQGSQDQQKGPAQGSTSIKAPAASAKSQPLAIEKLYLKEGTVHVVLATKGGGKVRLGDYAQVKLTVEMTGLKKPGEWTLLQVDPKRGLTRARGTVDFDTGLQVKASKEKKVGTQVKATLSFEKWKTAKQETLTPMTATTAKKIHLEGVNQQTATTRQRVGQVSASRLPIVISTPSSGKLFRPGQTMYVHYRIDMPTDAGEVTFRLLSGTHEVATTTHHYEPSDLSGLDLSGAEIESAGLDDDRPVSLGTPQPDEGEPWGADDTVLTWTLPSADSLPYGEDYSIKANKGTLQGTSAIFKIVPPFSVHGGAGIDVEVLGTAITPGSDLVVRYYCWGCDCGTYHWHRGAPLYLHRESESIDDMGTWDSLGNARSGGERTETLHIPEDTTPARDYVVTIYGDHGCWGESNTFPILASSTESDFRLIRPNGGECWQQGTTQLIRWSVANLFGSGSSGEPDALYEIDLMRSGVSVEPIPNSGVEYDPETQTCSVSWDIPPTLTTNFGCQVRVQATNPAEAGTYITASAEYFTICNDCMVEDLTSAADYGIDRVTIGGEDIARDGNTVVDYYTDPDPTHLQIDVHVNWNGECPPLGCQPAVVIHERGDELISNRYGADSFPATVDNAVAHVPAGLPHDLTPGSTILLTAEIVCGNEVESDARDIRPVDYCEGFRGNNYFDFSVTLRDAGSRR